MPPPACIAWFCAAARAFQLPLSLIAMNPTLLVLTDFTAGANRSLDVAAALAHPLGARLVLLHVHRDSLLDPERLTGTLTAEDKEATQLALNSLTRQLPVPAVAEIGCGRVADVVQEAAQRYHPILLVLSRNNAEDVPDELATTTALTLLRRNAYPLLVVPPHAANLTPPQRVMIAADAEAVTLGEQGTPVHNLLQTLQAHVTVAHVTESATRHTAGRAREAVESLGLLRDLPAVSTSHVCCVDPARGILHAVQEQHPDLLVVLARPRSFWSDWFHRSVTARVLLHSPVPVLVLPVQEVPVRKRRVRPKEIDGLAY